MPVGQFRARLAFELLPVGISGSDIGTSVLADPVEWRGRGGPDWGTTPAAVTQVAFPASEDDRRTVLAVSSKSSSTMPVPIPGPPGFGWAGGTPDNPIDVSDWPMIASSTTVASVLVRQLWVTTMRIGNNPVITSGAAAVSPWVFYEGELVEDHEVWSPSE